MSDKSGRSEEKEDFWGNKYTQHYDEDGHPSGKSESKEGILGDKYVQHYDADSNKTGTSEHKEGIFGDEYTQHYDTDHTKSGHSENKEGLFGDAYTENFDKEGNSTGWSERKETLFGDKYSQKYAHQNLSPSKSTGGTSGEGPSEASVTQNSSYTRNEESTGVMGPILFLILISAIFLSVVVGMIEKKRAASDLLRNIFENSGLDADYQIRTDDSKPSWISGDFDGDGKIDYACYVQRRDRSFTELLILFGNGQYHWPHLEANFPDGGWELFPRTSEIPESPFERGSPPHLKGDALFMWKPESSSAILYWNGSKFSSYFQAD